MASEAHNEDQRETGEHVCGIFGNRSRKFRGTETRRRCLIDEARKIVTSVVTHFCMSIYLIMLYKIQKIIAYFYKFHNLLHITQI